ncbi:hypothetical protein PUN28_020737 [Cardiocondyla obscurior]|uniref:Tudor domain-containing protein n=1 Tax=Cardiocondyla obscurior TaxID=286306 RepID=A0AAW2E963_9HYME
MATVSYIDTHQLTRSPLEVQVLEVESPTLFWVKLKNGEGELNELLRYLTLRMTRIGKNLTLAPDCVEVGTLVAVKEKGRWQRGIVTEVTSHTDVTIHLRDWGRKIHRRKFDCCRLEERFMEQPWQAVPCGIHGVKPTDPSGWTERDIALVRLLIEKQWGRISIRRACWGEFAEVDFSIRKKGDLLIRNLANILESAGAAYKSTGVMINYKLGLNNVEQKPTMRRIRFPSQIKI